MNGFAFRTTRLFIACVALVGGCVMTKLPMTQDQIRIAAGVDLKLAPPWKPSTQVYANATEIVYPSPAKYAIGTDAKILVTTEQRLDANDARKRLISVARSREAQRVVSSIGGWPAIEMRFSEELPEKGVKDLGGERENTYTAPVPRARVAIAFDQRVVLFDMWFAPTADKSLPEQAIKLAEKTVLHYALPAVQLQKAVDDLRQELAQTQPAPPAPPAPKPNARPDLNATPLPPRTAGGGVGELEVVSNANGSQIAIATNSGLVFSADGGATFAPGSTGMFPTSDPTMARGASGSFYLGGIAFPTAVALPAGSTPFTGCANHVSVSPPASGGAAFTTTGLSVRCGLTGSLCFPDQPHIAADMVNSAPAGTDQLYAVWRHFTPTPCIDCPPTCRRLATSDSWQTSQLVCSQDAGVTWTTPGFALPGDHPRVSVGADGKVYVVTLDGNTVKLLRFSSCSLGMVPDPGFPLDVADSLDVRCPLPGVDRCATALSSPTAAPDPANASHIFVTYARRSGAGNFIVAKESNDGGRSFGGELLLSGGALAPRFMPWSCATMRSVFAGWYDRSAATATANDLTDYFLGGNVFPAPINLSVTPDPQCASGWPVGPREEGDAESCTTQPQLAGRCLDGSGSGSNTPCDFSSGGCPSGESCRKSGGAPKYGDYNGLACTNNSVIAAWTSATAPPGLPAPGGLTLFARVVPLAAVVPSWDQLRFDIATGEDDARESLEIIASVTGQGSFCLKPSTGRSPDTTCPTNGGSGTDQTGRKSWHNGDGVITQTFTVPVPQTSASGFATMTLSTFQGTCGGCTSDNWNVENMSVTAIDSTGTLPPSVLLNLTSGSGSVNSSSCVMRLKEAPNASTATLSLVSPPTNVRTYVGGPSAGLATTCGNNGG